jgi:DNA-binding transcriptional LysR family regulator
MDQLQSMRTFVHVAQAGSLARAAPGLGMTPAAAARALADLESHLGTRLFRQRAGASLTAGGRAYLARSRAILADLAAADGMAGARGPQHEAPGALHLLVPMAFALHQLAKHLPEFHARFPGVTVALTAAGHEGSHDLCIDWGPVAPRPSASLRRLARTEIILCAAPDYLDREGRPSEPGMLGGHSLLLASGAGTPGHGVDLALHRRGGTRGRSARAWVPLSGRAPIRTPHAELAYAGALAGLGICGLPSFMAEDAVQEGALELVLPGWHLGRHIIWAIAPRPLSEARLTNAMVDFLVETFGGRDQDPWLGPRATHRCAGGTDTAG